MHSPFGSNTFVLTPTRIFYGLCMPRHKKRLLSALFEPKNKYLITNVFVLVNATIWHMRDWYLCGLTIYYVNLNFKFVNFHSILRIRFSTLQCRVYMETMWTCSVTVVENGALWIYEKSILATNSQAGAGGLEGLTRHSHGTKIIFISSFQCAENMSPIC